MNEFIHNMNLLYLAEDYPYSKVHHQLCRHIVSSEKNINVKVYTVLRANILSNDLRSTYTDINYQVLSYKLGKAIKRYKYDFFFKIRRKTTWLIDKVDIKNIDMLYAATLFSEGAVAYQVYKSYAIPYVVVVRATDVNFYLKYMFHLWPLAWNILRFAHKIVFMTEAISQHFFSMGITLPVRTCVRQKMKVIPNGIEPYWILNAKNKHHVLIPRRLLFIGTFNDNKNILTTMKVVERLSSRYEGLHLTLVGGGGNQHEKVLEYCKEHPKLFTFKGKILDSHELSKVFAESDIFVMVSHSETFGLVYIEALSQGLPIIYSKGQGIDGTLKEKVGEAADSHSEKSIEDALVRLIDGYNQYSPIGKSLYRFSWDNIACNVMELICKKIDY
ncbi:glycosyltransferase family 4 protein [Phocaeicola sp.]|uniref:glycosyltransferase family 4 protein n=1 Tax=Phocaeicola sp. TaxID=2773926 RepID=UPI0023C07080|nr:glycosyltransferase family 4 protein [Phocaeicola sp.]MDE5678736.1 glycosyltransferase family 4 protein [Phocaeicola sp.]